MDYHHGRLVLSIKKQQILIQKTYQFIDDVDGVLLMASRRPVNIIYNYTFPLTGYMLQSQMKNIYLLFYATDSRTPLTTFIN